MNILTAVTILPLDEKHASFADLTVLVNRAYSFLADMGLNYVAATQDEAVTRSRMATAAQCWVAVIDGRLVGTVSYYDHRRYQSEPMWYGKSGVCHFGLFAVEPDLQGHGIGLALMSAAEQRALTDGKSELSCDTAEQAEHLIRFYRKHGYRVVGQHRWPHATYDSIVLSKHLDSGI